MMNLHGAIGIKIVDNWSILNMGQYEVGPTFNGIKVVG